MRTDLLIDAQAKISRAREHVQDLLNRGVCWAPGEGCQLELAPEIGREPSQVLRLRFDADRSVISAIVGEAVYQLRSALDVALNAIGRRAGLANTKHIYFPFASSGRDFENSPDVKKKLEGIPIAVVDAIRDLQPWPDGNEALSGLNRLRNEDAHNALIKVRPSPTNLARLTGGHIEAFILAGFAARITAVIMDASDEGDILIDVSAQAQGGEVPVDLLNEHIKVVTTVTFDETMAFGGEETAPTLLQLCDVLDEALTILEEAAA